ncbi:MAG: hypothetical protein IJ733_05275 [Lachnospiraceae bacterium]|nr:hypothetical protein [Lachnospiraceae bacterium]
MKIPQIKNALRNIKGTCEERLRKLYPAGLPALAEERYRMELSYLETSEQVNGFEIYRCLVRESEKCAGYVTIRGTAGGSFLIYLMGHSLVNPLPAHYYCPKCGHFEVMGTEVLGSDLPRCSCPSCGSALRADGCNLPVESVWGVDGKKQIDFDFNANRGMFPFAEKLLTKLFPQNSVVPYGMLSQRDGRVFMDQQGFLLLPLGRTMEDYEDLKDYLDDGEECLSGNLQVLEKNFLYRVMVNPNELCDVLVSMQQRTGTYIRELMCVDISSITWKDIVNTRLYPVISEIPASIFRMVKPKNFMEMLSLEAYGHSSYADCQKEDAYSSAMARVELLQSSEFSEYGIYSREDVFDFLTGIGFNREKAFEVMEFVRMGKAGRKSEELEKILEGYELPKRMECVFKKCLYLFSRAHCACYLFDYARLAVYMKMDSRGFSQVLKSYGMISLK